jgi:hypothetical protein
MTKSDTYIVELTYEEALTFALAHQSSGFYRAGRLHQAVSNVGRALLTADPSLDEAQYDLWDKHGNPSYNIQDWLPRISREGELE